MILVLVGASGSGKSAIQDELVANYNFKRIVSYTTRKPRSYEKDGVDYHFISDEEFESKKRSGFFAEWSEYTQNRKYGTAKVDYCSKDQDIVVVLTPDGLRSVRKNCTQIQFNSVLVICNLGERIKRYIDRIGSDNFTYDDKNEIASRVDRDYGMFLNVDREVDLVVDNSGNSSISVIAKDILSLLNQ